MTEVPTQEVRTPTGGWSRLHEVTREVHRGFIAEWMVTIILLLFGTTTLVQAFVIPTGSMEDTLLIGDHLLVDKLAFAPAGPYAASKHAALAFSRSAAADLRPRGIRVHTVNPGFVETEGFPQRNALASRLFRRVVIDPEDVARHVLRSLERGRGETYVPAWFRVFPLGRLTALPAPESAREEAHFGRPLLLHNTLGVEPVGFARRWQRVCDALAEHQPEAIPPKLGGAANLPGGRHAPAPGCARDGCRKGKAERCSTRG